MTGYQSKKAASQDKLAQPAQKSCGCANCGKKDEDGWALYCVACIDKIEAALAQPAQEPASLTFKEVADAMNELRKGTLDQKQIAKEMGSKKLYTAPPQRP